MSWIKENQLLAGFAGVTLVGVGALGFLSLQSKGRYEETLATCEQDSQELNRLQTLQPEVAVERPHYKMCSDLQGTGAERDRAAVAERGKHHGANLHVASPPHG